MTTKNAETPEELEWVIFMNSEGRLRMIVQILLASGWVQAEGDMTSQWIVPDDLKVRFNSKLPKPLPDTLPLGAAISIQADADSVDYALARMVTEFHPAGTG